VRPLDLDAAVAWLSALDRTFARDHWNGCGWPG
jgi:hypothetical protein